jgi:uncharacterized protein YndB with AHSA1/START domain
MAAPTSSNSAKVTLPTDEQILVTREFNAPRHLVYEAYTTPEHVRRWWAGRRGRMTVAEIDLRVGGTYRYAMIANEGHEVAFHGEFREIVPTERIVHTEVFEGAPEGESLDTVTFEEAGGRTILTILMELPSKEVRDMIVATGMEGGMQESLDLLEELSFTLAQGREAAG